MIYYLIAWTAWSCPWWAPKAAPRQLVCTERREMAVAYDWPSAVAKVRAAGPGVSLWQLKGTFLQPVKLKWRTELDVVEEP